LVDHQINIPSSETPKIQEGHIATGHIICSLIEEEIFGAEYNPARKSKNSIMKVIILAGGFGTRLKHLLPDVPKPMADISGRPFLEWLMDYLADAGVSEVILSVHYLKEKIIDHFGDKYKNIKISYALENEPLGTGGAILNSIKDDEKYLIITAIPLLLEITSIFLRTLKPANRPPLYYYAKWLIQPDMAGLKLTATE
jgi:hypothetical protein